MHMRTIIIDDEPPARRVLEKYISDSPNLELVASCAGTAQAREVLAAQNIDLMLLDIHMPGESGLEFLRSLSNPPMVIFVTAFPEHAVEGFELEAVDYLVKPFGIDRFKKALERAAYLSKVEHRHAIGADQDAVLMIKADKKLYRMPCREILYLESVGDYIRVVSTRMKPLLPKMTLKKMLNDLPSDKFMQIHRSYAVAIDAVQYIEGNQVSVNDILIPVSETFRRALVERLSGPISD
jgi:two-component system, LytTR family, response regulator